MKNKVMVFDFDGVICDSTEECLITGYNAWLKYNKRDGFVTNSSQIPFGLAKYFRVWRGLVRTAGQYFVIFNSYKNSKICNEPEFEQACGANKKEMKMYEKLFFESRDVLKKRDIPYWVGLHRTYANIPASFKEILKSSNVFVVTGKDMDSVNTFLKHIGIDFPDSKIYDKNAAVNKLAALEEVARATKKELKDIIFIDDNINHLLPPKQKGCKVYMARWGYHSREQLKLAKDSNVPVVELEDWVETLLGKGYKHV